MTTWFTSDQHFFHRNIITYCNRPYTSVEAMNEDLILRYNTVVKPEDVVYHLGDFSMSLRGLDKIVPRLSGRKRLILGNHDKAHPANRRKAVPFRVYSDLGFETVTVEDVVDIGEGDSKVTVKLCHLPYEPDEFEKADRRYMELRPKDEGHLLLHGHVHCAWLYLPEKRLFNVGVDRHDYAPWSSEDILAVVKAGPKVLTK